MKNLVSYLFETNAMKICPDNKPFWYTSGKIGPYYINTHFVYGSETSALDLLAFIDSEKDNKANLPHKLFRQILEHYNTNEIYKNVIDEMVSFLKTKLDTNAIDYISGGERRDWFFSIIIANLLKKPHITIYKDLSIVINNYDYSKKLENLNLSNAKVLHIADLITEASSYIRAWIPAIDSLGAKICWSLAVVDRMQGGSEKLKENNIESLSMINIDETLFAQALKLNIINENQFNMLKNFYEHPDKTMKDFLANHPEFMENALNSDEKTVARAKLCLEQKFYE